MADFFRPAIHEELRGLVDYYAFHSNLPPPPYIPCGRHHMVRLFIGQLPYAVTPAQVVFAIGIVTGGYPVYHVEHVVKRTTGAVAVGCVYAYCLEGHADAIVQCSKLLLFDGSGVWCASNPSQQLELENYVALASGRVRPTTDIPHRLMVIERPRWKAM